MPLTADAAPDILYAFCHLILKATELVGVVTVSLWDAGMGAGIKA